MIDKKEYYREYYKNNKEKYGEYVKKYRNSEKGKKKIKEYREKNKVKLRKWMREYQRKHWKKTYTPQRKLYSVINMQIRRCLLRVKENKKIIVTPNTQEKYELCYGINLIEIVNHLKPFLKKLKEYELDHIIPISQFDLTKREEWKKAYSKENLQLLLPIENHKKGKY